MEIEELEEDTYLYIRYRCNAGKYNPIGEQWNSRKSFIRTKSKELQFIESNNEKIKKKHKNKVEVQEKDLDSEDDEEDVKDMDLS